MAPTHVIKWQAPEYVYREKNEHWFKGVGLTAGVATLLALLFGNFLFAVILLLSGFTIMLYGARKPEVVTLALTPKGVRVKDRLYPFDQLKSFWVDDEKGEDKDKIIVESNRIFQPHLILPLTRGVNPEEARKYLSAFLPAVRHEDTLADVLGDILGF